MHKKEELFNEIIENLPPIVIRSQVGELTFGLVSPKSLSNADAEGTGPAEADKLYGKVVYSRQNFIDWLEQQLFKNEDGLGTGLPRHIKAAQNTWSKNAQI